VTGERTTGKRVTERAQGSLIKAGGRRKSKKGQEKVQGRNWEENRKPGQKSEVKTGGQKERYPCRITDTEKR